MHRTMIRDRVRTEAFQAAIDAVVRRRHRSRRRGGKWHLSVFAARAGAARVYAVEQTSVAVLAQELAAANHVEDIVRVIQGDVLDIEPPERVDVVVSEWLGGFGIDEGMLVPVIAARDRWLKPGGVMIPHSVTAWAALVHDRYLADMVSFLQDKPYGLRLDDLVDKTVNEILYSGTYRHLAAGDMRSGPSPVDDRRRTHPAHAGAGTTRSRDIATRPQPRNRQRARTLVQRRARARHLALGGTRRSPTHWGMTTAPLSSPVELWPGMVVRARVRTTPARPVGTWTSWAIALRTPTGRSTTSRRFGRRSTTERSQSERL